MGADPDHGCLAIDTYAADSARAGAPTSFRVRQVTDPARARVVRDGSAHGAWRVSGVEEITVESDVGDHQFVILGGDR